MRRLALLAAVVALAFAPAAAQAQATQNAQTVTPLSSAAAAGVWVVNAAPVKAIRIGATNAATAGYLMVFDLTAAPTAGALTGNNVPKFCRYMAANTSVSLVADVAPLRFNNGLVLGFSTTGCATLTYGTTVFFEASVK